MAAGDTLGDIVDQAVAVVVDAVVAGRQITDSAGRDVLVDPGRRGVRRAVDSGSHESPSCWFRIVGHVRAAGCKGCR